jgi:hypothetical protein
VVREEPEVNIALKKAYYYQLSPGDFFVEPDGIWKVVSNDRAIGELKRALVFEGIPDYEDSSHYPRPTVVSYLRGHYVAVPVPAVFGDHEDWVPFWFTDSCYNEFFGKELKS